MRVLTQAAERSEPYDSMPAPKDPAAPASMLVLARTAVHATSHGGGIFVSILHLLPYLQAVLTGYEPRPPLRLSKLRYERPQGRLRFQGMFTCVLL